jgi:hypothetical protein
VIARNTQVRVLPDEFDALLRVRIITDDIAKADDGVNRLLFNIIKHSLKRFNIAVDIGDYGIAHFLCPPLIYMKVS